MTTIRFWIRRFRDDLASFLTVVGKSFARNMMNLAAHVRSK